ncbi:MAG: hypothetical protein JOZ18_19035 [Chloroflexi bacterium]|nr:hypothetical protein [Chloroflexota bacterium]
MEVPLPLQYLAQILKLRRESQPGPYHLLLTSAISLTPSLLRSICHSVDWDVFRTYIQGFGQNDRISILQNALRTTENVEGYSSLARLIADGYFSTILTTNLDTKLEEALERQGLRHGAVQTIVVGRDTGVYVARLLDMQANGILIVKLHGSLEDGVLSDRFPDFFELHNGIRQSVKRYLNQDLVIVGSLAREDDIVREFSRAASHTIYYATPEFPEYDDEVVKVMEARRYDASKFIIDGPYGTFDGFFGALEAMLLESTSVVSIPNKRVIGHLPRPTANTTGRVISVYEDERSLPASLVPNRMPLLIGGKVQLIEQTAAQSLIGKTDILLVTATEVEAQAVLRGFEVEVGRKAMTYFIGDKTYYDLGIVGEAQIVMVQSEMGSGGPGGSLLTIEKSIQALSPSAIIMVGVAFGCDPKKQAIGDVLVSRQLVEYELQRISSRDGGEEEIRPRGDRPSASPLLLDRFISGLKEWSESPTVHVGLILSGLKLIDHIGYREQLRKREPEAIGGEMEGAGLYAAADRNRVDWLLVKAICDWADGNKSHNKEQYQRQAAHNAAQYTIHVLRRGGFTSSYFL